MKYGVNTMVWSTHISERHSPLFSRIREWGFDGVEFFLSPSEPSAIPSVRRMLDEIGLERTTCSVLPRALHERRNSEPNSSAVHSTPGWV